MCYWPFLLLKTTLIGPLQMLWMSLSLNSTSVELLIRHILILCFKTLLTSVAMLLSSLPQFNMLETGCMLSLLHSLVYILKIVSSAYVCATGLESNLLGKTRSVLYVVVSLILWGTIMSHVEEMLTSFLDITVSVMCCPYSHTVTSEGIASLNPWIFSTYLVGTVVNLQLLTFPSSLRCRHSQLTQLLLFRDIWQAVCVKMFYAQTGTFFLPHVRIKVHTYMWKLVRTYGTSYVRMEV